ncbi:MobA/MobL family protein [Azospirillum argentinense]
MTSVSNQYHCQIKPVSRSVGRSVVAAAAYRSGTRLGDARTGLEHDYRRKRGVVASEVIVPAGCDWAQDRASLWGNVEGRARANARLATEAELAIPCELTPTQATDLVRAFALEIVAEHGVAADVAIHRPHPRQGAPGDPRNIHAHILFSHLLVTPDGLAKGTSKAFAGAAAVEHIRARWAHHVNVAYRTAGLDVRQDHRSYREQGVNREPGQHLGPEATALERAGMPTQRGDHNRRARNENGIRHRVHRAEAQGRAVSRMPGLAEPEIAPVMRGASPPHASRMPTAQRRQSIPRSDAQSDRTKAYVLHIAHGRDHSQEFRELFDKVWTFREPVGALKLRLADGSGRLTDYGSHLTYQPSRGTRSDTPAAVAALLELAEAKGWASVVINGPPEFQIEAARQATARGIEIDQPSPAVAAIVAAERARIAAEAEPHRALIDRINARAEAVTPAALRDDLTAAALPAPEPTIATINAQVARTGTAPVRSAWSDAVHRRDVAHACAAHRGATSLLDAVDCRRRIGVLCAATPAAERGPIAALLAATRAVVGEDAAEDWRSLCTLIPPPEHRDEHARRLAEAVAFFSPPVEPEPEPVLVFFLNGDGGGENPDADQPEQAPEAEAGHGETAPVMW